jgi:hypothetical protein
MGPATSRHPVEVFGDDLYRSSAMDFRGVSCDKGRPTRAGVWCYATVPYGRHAIAGHTGSGAGGWGHCTGDDPV